ncbi:MAG: ParB/RepB/Spo0J family partition protein [Gammaproteobacteria bacterium]|nr:ParB/RepB/Spo0J family partition protein [Gammaproteobacteria bacterium]
MTDSSKSSIGAGLDALFNATKKARSLESQDKRTLVNLSIYCLAAGQYQPRHKINAESIAQLADSIKHQGIIQPIIVRYLTESKYEVIAGERRWRAAEMLGIKEVPAIIMDITNEEAAAFALIENLQREDLNPIEEALGYQRLIDEFKLRHEDIANRVGKSRATITNTLRLLNLQDEVKHLLKEGRLGMGHARALLALSEEIQIKAAHLIAEKELSVREAESLAQKLKNPAPVQQEPNEELKHWANTVLGRLSGKLSSQVKINVNHKGEGRVVISFSSPEEVDWLIEKIVNENKPLLK